MKIEKILENRMLAGLGILFIFSVVVSLVLAGDVIINAPAGEINATTINAPTGRTATYVVCANDSVNKAQCDYVCDGVADNVEIQAAIDALPDSGGKVILMDGTYYVNVSIKLKSNISLMGVGKSTRIVNSGTVSGDDYTLKAEGNSTNQIERIEVRDLSLNILNSKDDAVTFMHVKDGIIENLYINSSGEEDIELIGKCENIIIRDNRIIGGGYNSNPQIDIYFDVSTTTKAKNVRIDGNILSDAIDAPSIKVLGDYIIVRNNVIENNKNNGIKVIEESGAPSGNIILDSNIIYSNISPSSNSTSIGIECMGDSSNIITNIQITNNKIYKVGKYAILIKYTNNVLIEGNQIDNCGLHAGWYNSIYAEEINHCSVVGNIVTNANSHALRLASHVYNATILSNKLTLSNGYGIYVDSDASSNVLKNNDVRDNSNSPAIYLGGSGNQVRGNIGYTTENSGNISKKNGDTISHGLDCTPTYISVTPSNADHIASVTAKSSSTFTLGLKDYNGTAITTPEEIYWYAEC